MRTMTQIWPPKISKKPKSRKKILHMIQSCNSYCSKRPRYKIKLDFRTSSKSNLLDFIPIIKMDLSHQWHLIGVPTIVIHLSMEASQQPNMRLKHPNHSIREQAIGEDFLVKVEPMAQCPPRHNKVFIRTHLV